MDNQAWEIQKPEIKRLYLKENKTLKDVMYTMETVHGFSEKKSRYEAKFKEWDFRKNRGGAAKWKFIKERLKKRKAPAEVYIDGILQPPEKVRVANNQQTYRSTIENIMSETSPKTPDGVFICSPGPVCTWQLPPWPSNLPWFAFSRMAPLKSFEAGMSLSSSEIYHASQMLWSTFAKAEASVFSMMESILQWKTTRKLAYIQSASRAAAMLRVIMPEEHEGQHLSVAERLCEMPEQLPLLIQITFFMLSNNIRLSSFKALDTTRSDVEISGEHVFVMRILRTVGLDNLQSFKKLLSFRQVTAQALAENLFESALRSLDFRIVQIMLEAGMNPSIDLFDEYTGYPINSFEFVASLRDYDMAIRLINTMLPYCPISIPNGVINAALCAATEARNADLVRMLVPLGATPTQTALRRACYCLDFEGPIDSRILQYFLDNGADTEIRSNGRTLLGRVRDDESLTHKLLKLGADVEAVQIYELNYAEPHYSTSEMKTSALGIAAAGGYISVMSILLAAGANVNPGPDSEIDLSPLVVAVHEKQVAATRLLLSAGADIPTGDRFQGIGEKTSLCLVERAGSNTILRDLLLAGGARPKWEYIQKIMYSQLLDCIEKHEVESVTSLLALGALIPESKLHGNSMHANRDQERHAPQNSKRTLHLKALELSVKEGNCEIVSLLIDAGAVSLDMFVPSIGNLQTAILLADLGILSDILRASKLLPITSSIIKRDKDLMNFLLSHAGDFERALNLNPLNISGATCLTPLEAAICLGDLALARTLINHGAIFTELELNAIIWKTLESDSYPIFLGFWNDISSFSGSGTTAFAMVMQAKDRFLFEKLFETGISLRGKANVLFQEDKDSSHPVSLVYKESAPAIGGFIGKESTIGWWNGNPPEARLVTQPVKSLLEAAVLFDDQYFLRLLLNRDEWTREEKGHALTMSLICNSMSLFQDLLNSGADVHQEVSTSKSRSYSGAHGCLLVKCQVDPFGIAVDRGDIDLMQSLIAAGFDTQSSSIREDYALNVAIDRGHWAAAKFILSLQESDGQQRESLGYESAHSSLTEVRTLFRLKVGEDGSFGNGLEYAIQQGPFGNSLIEAIHDSKYEIVAALIKSGAQVSNSALEVAVGKQDTKLLDMMVKNVGDQSKPPYRQGTALQFSVEQGNIELIDYLLDAGADVNQVPAFEDGLTALQVAASKGFIGIARRLIYAGADIKAPRSSPYARTALEGASQNGHIDMLQLLLNEATFTEARDRKSLIRAVLLAEYRGYLAASKLLRSEGGWFDSDHEYYEKKKLELEGDGDVYDSELDEEEY